MNTAPIEVSLALTPQCPHCPSMLEILGQLVKKGEIGALHVINIATATDYARLHGIRSVPWMMIGPFVLQGLHNRQEIEGWLARSRSEQGVLDYFTELLSNGELASVTHAVKHSPHIIRLFIPLISSDETNINVRLGIGAILEDLAGEPLLNELQDDLIRLLGHHTARVRGDAAHFLSFVHSRAAIEPLRACLNDPDAEVREIAQESLEALTTAR